MTLWLDEDIESAARVSVSVLARLLDLNEVERDDLRGVLMRELYLIRSARTGTEEKQ